MGKYSLIVVAGFVFTFGYMSSNLNEAGGRFIDLFVDYFERSEAKLTAGSMANMALATLADSTMWRSGFTGVSIGGGTGWATVVDNGTDTTLALGQVRVTAGATSGSATDTVVVVAQLPTVPPGVQGGITANSNVRTLGNLVIDGRDHNLAGTPLPSQGTMGVSTMGTYNQGGSSTGGGTAGGVDYMPSDPANPAIIEENATYTFPSSPDDVFGYSDGVLKAMAQSGANGSQYATNPANLSLPLSGVTYLELASGAKWQSMDFGASSGVLVVHNSSTDAAIKNLNAGTFAGLIIADDIEKVHCTIIGAVIAMSTNPSGNCIGNGSGEILYSREALEQSAAVAVGGSGTIGVSSWLK